MKSVRYVGPHRALPDEPLIDGLRPDVEIAAAGDWRGCWAEAGKAVEVPDEVAGKAPKGADPGEGLLAQTGNWEAVSAPKTKEG